MINQGAGALALARSVFKGMGYIGGLDFDSLSLDIGAEIDSLYLSVAVPDFAPLNVAKVRFFDQSEREYDKELICCEVLLSSDPKKRTPEAMLAAFCGGEFLESADERCPTLLVRLSAPTMLGRVDIYNRAGHYPRRARHLVVRAFRSGNCELAYDNLAPERYHSHLASLCNEIAVDLPGTIDPDEAPLLAAVIRTKLAALLADPSFAGWDIRRLQSVLPLFDSNPEVDELSELACARIVLSLMSKTMPTHTKDLAFVSHILNSDKRIYGVQRRASELASLSHGRERQVVISKHQIHFSRLVEKAEAFLALIEEVVPILEDCGVQPMLCYGTLLGAVREGRLLAHDDDVDLLYFDGSTSHEEALQKKKVLIERLQSAGCGVWDAGQNFHASKNGVLLDLFPCWIVGDRMHLMMQGFHFRDIPASLILPRSVVEVLGRSYPAPANPAGFLLERYGPGWSVPDPFHEWPWSVARDT